MGVAVAFAMCIWIYTLPKESEDNNAITMETKKYRANNAKTPPQENLSGFEELANEVVAKFKLQDNVYEEYVHMPISKLENEIERIKNEVNRLQASIATNKMKRKEKMEAGKHDEAQKLMDKMLKAADKTNELAARMLIAGYAKYFVLSKSKMGYRLREMGVLEFPLQQHKNAQRVAEVAQCAHEQGRFWPYHDVLFKHAYALDPESLMSF